MHQRIVAESASRAQLDNQTDRLIRGCALFNAACEQDLVGVVGKWRDGSVGFDNDGSFTGKTLSEARDMFELFHQMVSREGPPGSPNPAWLGANHFGLKSRLTRHRDGRTH